MRANYARNSVEPFGHHVISEGHVHMLHVPFVFPPDEKSSALERRSIHRVAQEGAPQVQSTARFAPMRHADLAGEGRPPIGSAVFQRAERRRVALLHPKVMCKVR